MPTTRSVVLIALAGSALVAAACAAPAAPETPGSASSPSPTASTVPTVDAATASLRPNASAAPLDAWTWFDSSEHGYRIAYPPTLQLKDPANTSDFLALGADRVAILTVEPQPAGVDLDGYVKAFEDATLKDVGSGPVTSRLVEVGDRSWRVLEYLLDADGAPVWGQYALTMQGQNGLYLVVLVPADADTMADERRGFEQMLGTVTLAE